MAFSVADSRLTMKQAMPVASSRKTSPAWSMRFCTRSNSAGRFSATSRRPEPPRCSDALLDHLQITRLTRKMIRAYATIGQCPRSRLLKPEQQSHLEKYT